MENWEVLDEKRLRHRDAYSTMQVHSSTFVQHECKRVRRELEIAGGSMINRFLQRSCLQFLITLLPAVAPLFLSRSLSLSYRLSSALHGGARELLASCTRIFLSLNVDFSSASPAPLRQQKFAKTSRRESVPAYCRKCGGNDSKNEIRVRRWSARNFQKRAAIPRGINASMFREWATRMRIAARGLPRSCKRSNRAKQVARRSCRVVKVARRIFDEWTSSHEH